MLLVEIGAAPLHHSETAAGDLRQLGRTSLLVYWVHLEIIYGMFVMPWARERLNVPQALLGVAVLTLALLGLSYLRPELPRWWPRSRSTTG